MELVIVPIGTETPSLSHYVAVAIRHIRRWAALDDLKIEETSMATIIEGPTVEYLLDLAASTSKAVKQETGAERLSISIKLDTRTDKEASIAQKHQSVKNRLAE